MKKRLKTALIILVLLVLALSGAFLIYAADYYRADAVAIAVMQKDPAVRSQGDLIIISPTASNDKALIFYPGAKVEHIAYLPILKKIADQCDITRILVKMPFNMAIFNSSAADKIMRQFPEIGKWYIGGHSMGGAMASSYASRNPNKVKGLILLGAYVYGSYPPRNALTVYGTFNSSVAEKINYTENIVVIEGGNHAQFGNYGRQKGDPDATISSEAQQDIAVKAIKSFVT